MDLMDIEEVSKDDSFYLPSEYKQDEVEHILQQWKQDSSTSTVTKDSQLYVDTRTFTRPKKKFAQNFNYGNVNNSSSLCKDNENTINMKIGGLVTSMQKSFLNDVSPPKSIYSSMELSTCERMNNSLITSSDFSHVNFSMNNTDEINSETNFNNYKLTDVIKDREYLDNLTLLDNNLINNKDNHHTSITTCTDDNTFILDNTKIINDLEKNNLDNKNNEIPIINDTFCMDNHNEDEKNKTYEMSKRLIDNETFDLIIDNNDDIDQNIENISNNNNNSNSEIETTTNKLLKESFKLAPIIENMESPICEQPVYELQMSTPLTTVNRTTLRKALSYSPIEKDIKYEHAKNDLINCTNKMKDIEKYLNDVTRHITPDKDVIEIPKVRNIDEERMSLTNFEEFEKSISILENNENEREFDDMLNSFTGARKSIENERMRQSLDSIKKRHSLINLEKQQDDIKRQRENNDNNITVSIDSNKLIESTNKSINSSSSGGSERLLNRRSRINDNVEMVASQEASIPPPSIDKEITNFDNVIENNVENICKNVDTQNPEESDNVKNNRDRFKTMRIIRKQPDNNNIKNLPTPPCIDDDNELSHGDNERITTKNLNIMKQDKNIHSGNNINDKKSLFKQPFASNEQQKTNLRSQLARPKYLGINNCDVVTNNIQDIHIKSNSTESLSNKEKCLQLEYELDSMVDNNDEQQQDHHNQHQQTFIKSSNKYINNLKSPLGFKSKSIHNLLDNYPKNKNSNNNINNNKNYKSVSDVSKIKPLTKFSLQPTINTYKNNNNNNMKGFENYDKKPSEGITRMPQPSRLIRPTTAYKLQENNQSSASVNLRDKSKQSLMRPVSGLYSHKNEYDTESGRFSPNSLTSSTASSSSRGSTYQPVIFESNTKENTAMTGQEIQNKMFSKYRTQQQCVVEELPSHHQQPQPPPPQQQPQIAIVKSLPKPSGLRPPSVVNATGRTSGLPRPTSRMIKK